MLTQDPIGLAGGVNLYEYAGSNPIAFSDPFGLHPGCFVAPAACVAAAAVVRGISAAAKSPTGQRLAQTGSQRARELGLAGERAVSRTLALAKNVSERVGGRIPDFIDDAENVIAEIKNVAYQPFTRQLREMFQGAQESGRKVILFVRDGAKLSKPLQEAIQRYGAEVQKIPAE